MTRLCRSRRREGLRLRLTREQSTSQSDAVFARTAPEARGDAYAMKAWATPPETWRPVPCAQARAALSTTPFRARRIGAFLFALTAILANLAQNDVRAADAVLKPWAEGRLPVFALESLDGQRTDLAQLRSGAALVHFFATWCEPCRAELTALQQLHARLHDGSVTVVGVDVGEVDSRVRRFFAEQPVSFPILLDRDRAVSKTWRVSVLPTTVLLDRNFVPRFVAEGDVDWAQPEIGESLMNLIRQKAAGKAGAF
jgi:peroxiredoxin